MRKVLSFVLVLSLVLGSFSMAFAAVPVASDIAGKDCEDAVKVLTGLDVVSGYEDGTYRPENVVTRAEMAALIVKALGLNDYAIGTPKFTDCQNHWAKGYIAYANSLGVISGRSATTFDPDATVTYDEAATMLVKALGYTDDSLVGSWPTNFVTKAKVLGILDGVKSGATGANRGDVAIMLYQTLDQAIGKVNKDGDWVGTATKFDSAGKATEYDTMLARLGAKIYEPSGGFFNKDDQNFIVTGDEDAIINLTPYKGALVSAYMNDDKDIIAIKEVFSTYVSGSFGDVYKDLNTDTTFTLADGTEYTLKSDAIKDIKENAVEFLNGDQKNIDNITKDTQYTMGVKVSGKKITNVYSVLLWKTDADGVLKSDDVKDITNNKKLLGISFDKDNNNDIDLTSFELVGAASLDDIKADMVAYVYKNKDNKISRVAVGPVDKITGEVATVNKAGDKITIDGKDYKYSQNKLDGNNRPGKAGTGDIKAGDEVDLTMDAYGYIYDFEKTAGKADKYGVVLGLGEKKPGDIDSKDARISLFLADGSDKIFKVDEDKIANNLVITTGASVDWQSNVTAGAIVKYGLDKDGVITSLRVKGDNADSHIKDDKLKFDKQTGVSITSKGYYDGKAISKNAVLINYEGSTGTFDTPNMSTKASDYSIASYDKVLDTDKVDARYVYDTDKKEIVAMLMNNVTSAKDVYGVIVSAGTNNSDAGAYYNMLIDGKEMKYNGDDSYVNQAVGDLYRVQFDANGDIKKFANWYNEKDKQLRASIEKVNSEDAKLDNRTFSYNGDVKILTGDGTSAVPQETTKSNLDLTLDRDAVVYRYDKNDDEWQLGSTSDLRGLKDNSTLKFYDVTDEDGIYDVVLIDESGATSSDTSDDTGVIAVDKDATLTVDSLTDTKDIAKVSISGKVDGEDATIILDATKKEYSAAYQQLVIPATSLNKFRAADGKTEAEAIVKVEFTNQKAYTEKLVLAPNPAPGA